MRSNNDDGDFGLGLPKRDPSYEVGYGKPPKATRFKAGQSGNPKGRPKGSRNAIPKDLISERLKALVLEEAYRPIQIRDGGTLLELPAIQAALRSMSLQAAQGKQAAQRQLLVLVTGVEGERRISRDHPVRDDRGIPDRRTSPDRRSPSAGPRGAGIPAAPRRSDHRPALRLDDLERPMDQGGESRVSTI